MNQLLNLGIDLVGQGLQVMPMGPTKKPFWSFIPKKPDGTYSWSLFFRQNPANSLSSPVIENWLDRGACGLSLATGHVTVFDIDVAEYLGLWMQDQRVNEILYRVGAPIQLTGGGGYQIPLIVDVPADEKPKSRPLSFIPDENKASGRTVTIELKGVGSYAMLPFSRHPSGNLYEPLDWFGGSFAHIPTITRDEYETLVSAAKALCQAPKSRQTLQREERIRQANAEQAKRPKRTYSNEKVSVIDQFNDQTDIESLLDRYGYERVGVDRYSCPNSKNGSDVRITPDNASIHYSSYDYLEGKQTPFNLVCHFEHNDNIREAVKAIAEELGQDYASQYREERKAKPCPTSAQRVPISAPPSPTSAPPSPTSAQSAPQHVPQVPKEPDFGPPPFLDDESMGYGPTEYDDEPSYDDLLASCGALESIPPTQEPVMVSRNAGAADQPYQRIETAYDRFDWKGYAAHVRQSFDLAQFKKDKEIESVKGGVFKSVCFVEFGHDNTRKHWGKVLRAAAKYAGVPWPDFRRLGWTLDDTLAYAKHTAVNFAVITLEDDEYLSDVFDYNNLPFGVVTHTIAGCGIGKTRAADNVSPKSFYCPMSRQAETFTQSANGRGSSAEVVIEGYQHGGENVIFGTYDAAKKEIRQLSDPDKPISLYGRTQFIDEIQHVSHDAYRRSTALEPLIEASKLYLANGGRVVTLSGTPSPLLPAPLSFHGSIVIHAKRKNETTRKLFIFRESDPVEAILNLIKQGYTHISYSIDDKTRCEMICEALEKLDITARAIHSENKTSAHHKSYVGENGQDGVWDETVQVYVTTRATVDGFSVMIQSSEPVKLAEVFDKSLQYGSGMIEQRSRRIRNHPADVYVGFSDKSLEQLGNGGHFDLAQERNDEFRLAEIVLNSAKAVQLEKARQIERNEFVLGLTHEVEDANKQASLYTQELFKQWVRIDDAGKLEIDDFAIEQRITRSWVAKAHGSPDIMINELCSFGFEWQGMQNLTGNKGNASKRVDYEKEVKKARKEAKLTEIKSQAETMSDTQAQIVLENVSKIIKDEGDIGRAKVAAASLRRDLVKQGLTLPAAKEKIQALTSLRKDVIKRLESVVRQAKIRRASSVDGFVARADKVTRFYAALQDGQTFQLGEILTSAEIAKRVKDTAAACGVSEILTPYTIQEKRKYRGKKRDKLAERHDSDKKILKLIRDMFKLDRTTKRAKGVKTDCYEFMSFNEVELAPFEPSQPIEQAQPTEQVSTINPLDMLNEGLSEGYVSQDIGEHLTRLHQNDWLTAADFIQTLEELKASYDPDWL